MRAIMLIELPTEKNRLLAGGSNTGEEPTDTSESAKNVRKGYVVLSGIVVTLVALFMFGFKSKEKLTHHANLESTGTTICESHFPIGEIRNWMDKSQCIDPSGTDGRGEVATHNCDGFSDQRFVFCEDGTIRSSESGQCLKSNSNKNVNMAACGINPGNDKKWIVRNISDGEDSGITQKRFNLESASNSRYVLDIAGIEGRGNVGTWQRDGYDDQIFYLRNRGKTIGYGKLQNQESDDCLDVSGIDGRGDVQTYSCEDEADQVFKLYENGELVNAKSNLCLDIDGNSGYGNIKMFPCEALLDQQWKQVDFRDEYFALESKGLAESCVDVAHYHGEGNVGAYYCESAKDQRWRWISEGWTTPAGRWNILDSNESGSLTATSIVSRTSTYSLTESTSLEVTAAIESEMVFGDMTVSTTVANTIASSWTDSTTEGTQVTKTCDTYENGDPFTSGCAWQWAVTTNTVENDVVFDTPYFKCTQSCNVPPLCPPFERCVDEECSQCLPY